MRVVNDFAFEADGFADDDDEGGVDLSARYWGCETPQNYAGVYLRLREGDANGKLSMAHTCGYNPTEVVLDHDCRG